MTKLGQELIKGVNELIDYERDKKKLKTWDKFAYRGRIYSVEDWNTLQAFLGVLKKLKLYESND